MQLKADMHPPGKPTEIVGKCSLKARYIREFHDASAFPEPEAGDQSVPDSGNQAVNKTNNPEEISSVKKQLQKDIANDNKLILAALEAQNKMLNASISKIILVCNHLRCLYD